MATTNTYRTSTGERLVTLRPTIRLTAEDLTALIGETCGVWDADQVAKVALSDNDLREAVQDAVTEVIERYGYRVGDGDVSRSAEAALEARIVTEVFDGHKHVPAENR